MALKVFEADQVPRDQWQALTNNSVLSSPDLSSVWDAWKGRTVFFAEKNAGGMMAGMAGVIFGGRFFRRFESMPDGLYGGPFFDPDCDGSGKRRFFEKVLAFFRSRHIIRADIYNPGFVPDTAAFDRWESFTHVITLTGESYEPPHPRVREHIRSARRSDTVIRPVNETDRFEEFFKLVVKTERRHGTDPRYPKEFFRKLFDRALEDVRIVWLVVYHEGQMIASRISFVEQSQILNWQSFSDKRYSRLRPNYLMLDYIIRYALDHGIISVNLGGSPPGVDSLVDFKERWGGQKTIIPISTYFSTLGRLAYRRRNP